MTSADFRQAIRPAIPLAEEHGGILGFRAIRLSMKLFAPSIFIRIIQLPGILPMQHAVLCRRVRQAGQIFFSTEGILMKILVLCNCIPVPIISFNNCNDMMFPVENYLIFIRVGVFVTKESSF
jgi:hypothetical protein